MSKESSPANIFFSKGHPAGRLFILLTLELTLPDILYFTMTYHIAISTKCTVCSSNILSFDLFCVIISPYAKIKLLELKAESFRDDNKEKAKEAEGERISKALKKYSQENIYLFVKSVFPLEKGVLNI